MRDQESTHQHIWPFADRQPPGTCQWLTSAGRRMGSALLARRNAGRGVEQRPSTCRRAPTPTAAPSSEPWWCRRRASYRHGRRALHCSRDLFGVCRGCTTGCVAAFTGPKSPHVMTSNQVYTGRVMHGLFWYATFDMNSNPSTHPRNEPPATCLVITS